jgi:hypothetical protein
LTAQTNKIGAISVAASANLTLNAPHSGPLAGLAIIQDSNGLPPGTTYTSSHSTIGGAPGATLNGLVYVDAASRLEAGGCAGAGLGNLPVIGTVAVAE